MVYVSNTPTGRYVWILSPQLMMLFGETVEPYGNRTYLAMRSWGPGRLQGVSTFS